MRVFKMSFVPLLILLGTEWVTASGLEETTTETDDIVTLSRESFGPDAKGLEGTIGFTPQAYFGPQVYPEAARMTEDLVQRYQQIHPEVNIDLIELPDSESGIRTWLTTRIAGGRAPQIAWEHYHKKWEQAAQGWWYPLDEFLDMPNPYIPDGQPGSERWRDLIPDYVWNQTQSPDGNQYQITLDWVETGIYYNKEIFETAGVNGDWDTWEEFLVQMDKIRKAGYERVIALFILPGWSNYQWLDDIVTSVVWADRVPSMYMDKYTLAGQEERVLQKEEFARAVYEGIFTTEDPRFDAFLDILEEFSAYWGQGFTAADPNTIYQQFIAGDIPMIWDGTWTLTNMAREASFEYGITYLPPITAETSRFATGRNFRVGGPTSAAQYGITRQTVKEGLLEEAVDFLMFFSAAENSGQMMRDAQMFLPLHKGLEAGELMNSFQEIAGMTERFFNDPLTRLTSRAGEEYNRTMQEFFIGSIDRTETKRKIQEILDQGVVDLGRTFGSEWGWYRP